VPVKVLVYLIANSLQYNENEMLVTKSSSQLLTHRLSPSLKTRLLDYKPQGFKLPPILPPAIRFVTLNLKVTPQYVYNSWVSFAALSPY
jgi:hypothetical protein